MLRNLNIRKRLAFVYAVFALLIVAIGGVGVYSTQDTNASFNRYAFHVVEASQLAHAIQTNMVHLRRYEKDIVISVGDEAKIKDHAKKWEETYQKIQKDFDAVAPRLRDDKVKAAVQEARASLKTYHDSVAAAMPTVTTMDVASANNAMSAGRDGFSKAEKIVEDTLKLVDGFTQTARNKFNEGARLVLTVTIALGLISVAAMLLLGRVVSASIVMPLRKAQDFAEQVRDGDLTGDLSTNGQDEAASLSRALDEMKTSLARIVSEVRQAAESIQVASSEVASGNQDLSDRTEQTASSLQQTASSMNELTGTVNQTADSARTASQLASQASSSAERGGAVVGEVVTTMERINSSSRRIADIISTIDGIAFQTNILALNAAVEAARAGEAGRGFAVVAGEVRLLAQRSAEAAKEIKTLINASVESVDTGTRLVADAGNTMGEIVSNVQRVTDIIGEISAAAGEQSSGIGTVNSSVANLDQATQQNAALVEESAAAAQSLRDQAQRLAEVVSTFKLPGQSYKTSAVKASPRPAPPAAPRPARPAPKPMAAKAPSPNASPSPSPAPRSAPAPAPAPAGGDNDWETF